MQRDLIGFIRPNRDLLERVRAITNGMAELNVLDHRPEDEILGYDEHGAFL